jgi:type II secretory pathway component PulM
MSLQPFNAQKILSELKQFKITRKRPRYVRSRLHKYRAELVALRLAGASFADLALWLRQSKRIKVAHTTVMRFLKQLPEMQQEQSKE